jgi:hypothetical protein
VVGMYLIQAKHKLVLLKLETEGLQQLAQQQITILIMHAQADHQVVEHMIIAQIVAIIIIIAHLHMVVARQVVIQVRMHHLIAAEAHHLVVAAGVAAEAVAQGHLLHRQVVVVQEVAQVAVLRQVVVHRQVALEALDKH